MTITGYDPRLQGQEKEGVLIMHESTREKELKRKAKFDRMRDNYEKRQKELKKKEKK